MRGFPSQPTRKKCLKDLFFNRKKKKLYFTNVQTVMDSLLRDCNRLNTRITVMSKQDKDFTELQMKSLKRLKAKVLLSAYPFKNKGL